MGDPQESLESIAFLLQQSEATLLAPHLLSLVHRRTFALLELQSSLRGLAAKRDELFTAALELGSAVEDAIADDARGASSKDKVVGAAKAAEAERAFLRLYSSTVEGFEIVWAARTQEFNAWERAEPGASTSKETLPESWTASIGDGEADLVALEFLRLLLVDPATLGAGIATLEGLQLTTLLPSRTTPGNPPLAALFILVFSALGPDSVLALALGCWEGAIRELIGRESSRNAQVEGQNNPGAGARERELELFLVGMLEVLDSLGLCIAESSEPSLLAGATTTTTTTGPLALNRAIEDILLELLYDAQSLRIPSPGSPLSEPHEQPSLFSSASLGSAVVSTLSTISSYSTAGLYNVASIGGAGLSTLGNAAGLSFGPSSPSLSYTTSSASSSSAPLAISPPSLSPSLSRPGPSHPSSASPTSTPSLPSKFVTPLTWTPLSYLLTRSATSLLKVLTPSSSSPHPTPLVQRLLTHLLSTSFPFSSSDSLGHRKVLLLGVVRWWAFSRLGKIARAGSGGAYLPSFIPAGVRLSDPSSEIPATYPAPPSTGAAALLDEVYVSSDAAIDLFLGLHKTVYGAVVAACGFASASEWDERVDASGETERLALKKAAKNLVHAWCAGSSSQSAPPSPPCVPEGVVAAFAIGQDDFATLVKSFGALVLRSPDVAVPPVTPRSNATGVFGTSPAPTFKRSRAFSGSTASGSSGDPAALSGARMSPTRKERTYFSLDERLEIVVAEAVKAKGDPAVFYVAMENGRVRVTASLPSVESSSLSSKRKLSAGLADGSTEWASPPRSPRQEALLSSMQRGSYFSQQGNSPLVASLASTSASPLTTSPPSLTWKRKPSPQFKAPFLPEPSLSEIALIRKAIFTLVRQGWPRIMPPALSRDDVFLSHPGADSPSSVLIATIERAAQGAEAQKDFSSNILFSQTLAVLKGYQENLSAILERVAAPLREAHQKVTSTQKSLERHLADLEVQRNQLLDAARAERNAIDDVRIRAWYSSVKGGELGSQLRKRLSDIISLERSEAASAEANQHVKAWSKELGVYSFTRATGSAWEEGLMHVELAASNTMQPSRFYASPFWSRERDVVESLVASSRAHDPAPPPSFAESLLHGGSSLLSALPYASRSTDDLHQLSLPPPTSVVLSFGAASPALLKTREAKTAFVGAVEEHLLRVSKKLSGYMWSDVSSIVGRRDMDGRLFGADAWFEEFASPLSPLVRPTPQELEDGGAILSLPKAYQPSGTTTPPFVRDILRRLTHHPSPHAKLHSVLELELLMSALHTAPLSAHSKPVTVPTTPPTPRAAEQLQKLAGMLSKRLSLAPSPTPIAKLLEGEGPDADPTSPHFRDRSSLSAPFGFSAPSHSRQFSGVSDTSSLIEEGKDVSIIEPSGTPSRPLELSTDDLLAELEEILRHVRPPGLFQNLQIIGALTPPKALESILGKAYWDLSLAALSIKRDVVEGEFGMVERALTALADGTAESRELAERLIRIGVSEESSAAIEALSMLGMTP